MSHSRSKGHRPQQETTGERNQGRTPSTMNRMGEGRTQNYESGSNYRGSQNYGEQDYNEQERFGGQGGYGGSQGVYGSQGGYRAMNYSDRIGNPPGDSDFQGSRDYRGRWEGEMESGREPERQRSNVTRFGRPGTQGERGSRWNGEGSMSAMPQQRTFAGRGPRNYKRSNERITEDINEGLTQDPELDAADVSVEVKDGEVVLKGTVRDRESKRRAEEIAESCSGVTDVMNQLRIKKDNSNESENTSRRDNSEDKRNRVAS